MGAWAFFSLALVLGLSPYTSRCQTTGSLQLQVDAAKWNASEFAISSFIENNVNRGDDGGLYAVKVQNRAFQETSTYLTIPGWEKVGDASLYLDPDTPLAALKRSMEIYIRADKSATKGQRAGVNNTGWFGIPIKPQQYKASFWAKTDSKARLSGTIELSLASLTDGKTYASATFDTAQVTQTWKQFTTTLRPTATAPDSNNVLSLTMEVLPDRDQYAWFNLVSLFPPTFNNRTNGLRPDLAKVLADMKPKHVRIPGGSNMQGGDISSRYNWTLTLGALQNRPGRVGYWVGYQTEGLGLMELLDMIEDFGATPVLGVYDGYAADDESIPNTTQLDKYIESAVNELHFVLGDAKTNNWGKLRAQLGHPEPYDLQYVEIGNEDFTSTTYDYRWQRFYSAMKAAYPKLNFIATSSINGVNLPAVDVHDFSGPDYFYALFDRYDNWPRNGTQIWELENAVINTDSSNPFGTPDTRLQSPTLQGSIAEAVYLMGMQRNGDLVVATSYAPYLANVYASQWTPNMINFNISHISLSTSYYVHQMMSLARADKTHSVTSSAAIGPLYWAATSADNATTFFIEIANVNDTDISLTATIHNVNSPVPSTSRNVQVQATVLAASPGQPYSVANDLDHIDSVSPSIQNITATRTGSAIQFAATVKGWSFGIYRIDI
ncbi:glycoside hydrolase [Rickenella mellea]|uniref:non-reducing end alpha-L-arabinofuranosidase n=1 Tax=Rickenella mellea TaxID=50990 RepID=A0A4Y7Q5X8_9AGAM|nr:glycoside hydrolase [Rickenella mellea]